jgi:hypothetical protein
MTSKRRANDVHDNENLKKMPRLLEPEEELQLSRYDTPGAFSQEFVANLLKVWGKLVASMTKLSSSSVISGAGNAIAMLYLLVVLSSKRV